MGELRKESTPDRIGSMRLTPFERDVYQAGYTAGLVAAASPESNLGPLAQERALEILRRRGVLEDERG